MFPCVMDTSCFCFAAALWFKQVVWNNRNKKWCSYGEFYDWLECSKAVEGGSSICEACRVPIINSSLAPPRARFRPPLVSPGSFASIPATARNSSRMLRPPLFHLAATDRQTKYYRHPVLPAFRPYITCFLYIGDIYDISYICSCVEVGPASH